MTDDAETALSLTGIVKRFGAAPALDGASLLVRRGKIHALLGENGAGKTTLMRIAYGMLRPDAGELCVRDAGGVLLPRHFHSPADAIRARIGMVHQHFTLVPTMTVAENIALGGHGRFDARAAAARTRKLAAASHVQADPDQRVEELSIAAQQRIEILKALARDAQILILDEPTAVLAPAEAEELLGELRMLARGGAAVVLITHKLREALSIAEDVTVLRRGRTVLAAPAADASEASLAEAMLGAAPSEEPLAATARAGAVVIRAQGIAVDDDNRRRRVSDVSLDVRAGEIVGVAGIEGSGHLWLLRALAGRVPVAAGRLQLPEVIGYVPEDRHRDALVLDFSLAENFALAGAGSRRGLVGWKGRREETSTLLRDFDVRAVGPQAPAGALSGGNQQKLVLARELHGSPAALVAVNPTRGLDVRAAAAVQARVRAAAARGAAVVLHSSDLEEMLALATRMVVVHGGRLRPATLDHDAVGRAMLGLD